MQAKKHYVAPTLAALGCAVKKTRGRIGLRAELINFFFRF
jgi:hypothetical protein